MERRNTSAQKTLAQKNCAQGRRICRDRTLAHKNCAQGRQICRDRTLAHKNCAQGRQICRDQTLAHKTIMTEPVTAMYENEKMFSKTNSIQYWIMAG
ncbi:hypothetical protein ASG93_28240, partial [Paenibacillus sp. Soil787]